IVRNFERQLLDFCWVGASMLGNGGNSRVCTAQNEACTRHRRHRQKGAVSSIASSRSLKVVNAKNDLGSTSRLQCRSGESCKVDLKIVQIGNHFGLHLVKGRAMKQSDHVQQQTSR